MVFGYPGIAVPAPLLLTAKCTKDASVGDIALQWDTDPQWREYAGQVINHCITMGSIPPGILTIENQIPIGKGMGSSTALVIAIARCLLGKGCREEAAAIERAMNPGGSGIDFDVIWNEQPILFRRKSPPEPIDLPDDLLNGALLIDTGTPNEETSELITWVTQRKDGLSRALDTIGTCTERLIADESILTVIHDHHQAQLSLGIVTDEAKNLITKIEQIGGTAKVIGAGGRSGGSGMVLALNIDANDIPGNYPIIRLTANVPNANC